MATGAWTAEKVATFRANFEAFLKHCFINSKETGGHTCLGEHVYTAQKMALDAIFKGLSEDKHDDKFLKSRQLGISTITRALIVFWCGVHRGAQAAMVFDDSKNTENGRREIEDMIANIPDRLKFPKVKTKNRYGIILDNGSKIQFMSAGIRNSRTGGGLGRSSGFNVAWCSEMCSWENPEGIESFKQSLSETYENRLFIWESTGRGFNDWHTMWQEAVDDTISQVATFIGWWAKDSQRIDRDNPQFAKYGAQPITQDEQKRIDLVRTLYNFEVTIEQVAWYRRKMDPTRSLEPGDAEDSNKIQEQPWTADEAFQATGSTFFAADRLGEMMAVASKEKSKGYKYYPGTDFLTCDFLPARTYRDVMLKVWQEPDPNGEYVIAADPAFGHDERNDRSACQVIRCYADGVEQVAEFASASTPTNQFAWLIAALVGWYKNVTLIIEINGPGEAVWGEYKGLKQLVTQGYLRGAATEKGLRDIFNNTRNYIFTRSDSMGMGSNYHWVTNTQRKIAIMERLRDCANTDEILIRSLDTLEEMRSITRDGDTIKAEGRKKDDRVLALAMAVRAWEERVRRSLITQNRTRKAEAARLSASPQSRYNVFSQYQIDQVFKQKQKGRAMQAIAARRDAWKSR
jgi:hypothetical protein